MLSWTRRVRWRGNGGPTAVTVACAASALYRVSARKHPPSTWRGCSRGTRDTAQRSSRKGATRRHGIRLTGGRQANVARRLRTAETGAHVDRARRGHRLGSLKLIRLSAKTDRRRTKGNSECACVCVCCVRARVACAARLAGKHGLGLTVAAQPDMSTRPVGWR